MSINGNSRCINSQLDGERCTERMGLKTQCHYHYNASLTSKGGAKNLTKSEIKKVIELYSSGLSGSQVAGKLGISKPTVLRYARKAGVVRTEEKSQGIKYAKVRRGRWSGHEPMNKDTSITTKRYVEFRKRMYERDKWSCVLCGYKGSKLNLDHIKPRCAFPELLYDENNVRTLCIPCHKKTDTYGIKARLKYEAIK